MIQHTRTEYKIIGQIRTKRQTCYGFCEGSVSDISKAHGNYIIGQKYDKEHTILPQKGVKIIIFSRI